MTNRSQEIFARAYEMEGKEREALLSEECGNDVDLRQEVERLLADASRADSFFGTDDDEATLAADGSGKNSGKPSPPAFVPPTANLTEKEGDIIGPYKLLEQIGEGGFGTVWMAEQSEPIERKVALKVIKAGMDTKEVLARFEAERQAVALMDHTHIAKVLDAGATDSGRPFFAMELVKGIPITRFCDEQKLDTRQRLVLFGDVCSAINHAHQKGVIHRDIKPSNVMVSLQGDKPVVKVIDFGIAKATHSKLTDKTLFTRFDQFMGTPAYMSPEQAGLSGLDIDTRSDIYSLGVLLYELLAGRPPFDPRTLISAGYEEMRRIIREVEPSRPSHHLGTTSGEDATRITGTHGAEPKKLGRLVKGELDWIVMKAIEKDRARRYETANAFAADIGRYLANEPVQAAAPSAAYRFKKFARRNKAFLGTTAFICSVLAAATWVSVGQANRASEEARRSEQLMQAAQVEAGKAWIERAESTAENPGSEFYAALMAARSIGFDSYGRELQDGSFHQRYPIAFEPGDERYRKAEEIVRKYIHSPRPIWVGRPTGKGWSSANSLAFSTDGKSLIAGNTLWDLGSAPPFAKPLMPEASGVQNVATCASAKTLAIRVEDGTIALWDLKEGLVSKTLEGTKRESIQCMAISPEGGTLATGSGSMQGLATIKLWDLVGGGEPKEFAKLAFAGDVSHLAFAPDGGTLVSIMTGGAQREPSLVVWSTMGDFENTSDQKLGIDGPVLKAIAIEYPQDLAGRSGYAGISCVAVCPDGSLLAGGSRDGTIRLWNLGQGVSEPTLTGHEGAIFSVAFSHDGKTLASGSGEGAIKLWDLAGERVPTTLTGQQGAIVEVAFGPDDSILASRSADSTVLWELEDRRSPKTLANLDDLQNDLQKSGMEPAVAFSPDGKTFACKTSSCIELWDLARGQKTGSFAVPYLRVTDLAFGPAGKILAGAITNHQHDSQIILWDLVGREIKSTLPGSSIAGFSPDGKTLVCVSKSAVTLWDIETGTPKTIDWHHSFNFMDLSSDGGKIIIGSRFDDKIRSLRLGEANELEILCSLRRLNCVALSPDASLLAAGSRDGDIRVWNLVRDMPSTDLAAEAGIVSLKFSPDGKALAGLIRDGSVKVWNLAGGWDQLSPGGRFFRASKIHFNPDGKTITSVNVPMDGSACRVQRWELASDGYNLADYLTKNLLAMDGKHITLQLSTSDRPGGGEASGIFNPSATSLIGILHSGKPREQLDRELFWAFLRAKNWSSALAMFPALTDPAEKGDAICALLHSTKDASDSKSITPLIESRVHEAIDPVRERLIRNLVAEAREEIDSGRPRSAGQKLDRALTMVGKEEEHQGVFDLLGQIQKLRSVVRAKRLSDGVRPEHFFVEPDALKSGAGILDAFSIDQAKLPTTIIHTQTQDLRQLKRP